MVWINSSIPLVTSDFTSRSPIFDLNLALREIHQCCEFGEERSICFQVIALTPSADGQTDGRTPSISPAGDKNVNNFCTNLTVVSKIFLNCPAQFMNCADNVGTFIQREVKLFTYPQWHVPAYLVKSRMPSNQLFSVHSNIRQHIPNLPCTMHELCRAI